MKKIILILVAAALSFVPFEQTTAGQSGKNKWAKPKSEVKEVKKPKGVAGKKSKSVKKSSNKTPAKDKPVLSQGPPKLPLEVLPKVLKGIEKLKASKTASKDRHVHQETIDYRFVQVENYGAPLKTSRSW